MSTIFHSPPVGILFQPSHTVPPQKKRGKDDKISITCGNGRTDGRTDATRCSAATCAAPPRHAGRRAGRLADRHAGTTPPGRIAGRSSWAAAPLGVVPFGSLECRPSNRRRSPVREMWTRRATMRRRASPADVLASVVPWHRCRP